METDAEIAAPFIDPLVAAAKDLGLRVDAPTVLGAGANVVVHLAPSPVVARVATMTADMRGGAFSYLRRERDICQALIERGVDVAGPTDLVDPGPHSMGDRAFLLLGYQELRPVDLDSDSDATATGRALADLLTVMAELPPEVGGGDEGHPWQELDRLLTALATTTDRTAIETIGRYVESLRASEPVVATQLVHGDAHRVNVAYGRSGITWFDFEDANHRPMAWDLATLNRSWPAAGSVACTALGVDPTEPVMVWHHALREIYALLWAMYAGQCYQRAKSGANKRLAAWLDQLR